MADRVAVFNQGKIMPVGSPDDIYQRPNSRFVADFVGFDCPDYFVVGYGMDVGHAFRELPFVGVVKGEG